MGLKITAPLFSISNLIQIIQAPKMTGIAIKVFFVVKVDSFLFIGNDKMREMISPLGYLQFLVM